MSDVELFREYEQEFLDIVNSVKRDIPSLLTLHGESRDRTNKKIVKNLEIRHMELEANSIVNTNTKEQLKHQLAKYKEEARNLKKEHQEADKQYLFGVERKRQGDYDADEMEDMRDSNVYRNKMEQNSRMLEGTNETTDSIIRITSEIEEQATDTAETLRGQGERIRNTRNKVHDLDGDLRNAGSILGRMTRRQIVQKIVLVLVILLLLAIIGVILYFVLKPIFTPNTNE